MAEPGWSPPTTFDEYRLVQILGHGSMGQVYLGKDTLLDRFVAIKFISALAPDAIQRDRFLLEAKAVARIQHPNVVTVYRVGELGGQPYIISEFVPGKTLEQLPKPLRWTRVLEIAIGLSRG